jgi:hypothetical protein
LSSILKALKKLEQENPQNAYPRLWVRRSRAAGTRLMWIGGLIIIGFAAVGGSVFFFERYESLRPAAPPVDAGRGQGPLSPGSRPETYVSKGASEKNVSATTGMTAVEPPNAPLARSESRPAVAERAHDEKTALVAGTNHPAPVRERPADAAMLKPMAHVPVESIPKTEGAKSAEALPDLVRRTQPASPGNTRAATHGAGAAQEQAPVIPAKHLTESGLKIQAISWSVNPQERIAVVNSRIVREGQVIEGFRVKQINIDDMLLSRDGVDWTLRFVNN